MKCRFCKKELVNNSTINYGMFPMTPNAIESDVLRNKNGHIYEYKFTITLCIYCGLIQQLNQPDPNILYFRFKNEVTGQKWKRHFQELSKFILKNYHTNDNVLEIGSGDLQLANTLLEKGVDHITVVEKNIDPKNLTPKISFYSTYLEEIDFIENFDLVCSSHVFEHISNISIHLEKISKILNVGGHFIFSLPDFKTWIENFYLNSFNQEHIIYPTSKNIEMMLRYHGFSIKNTYEFEQHSLFIDAEFSGKKFTDVPNELTYEPNLILLNNFKSKLENFEYFINNKASEYKQIYIFGANSSTQLLLKKLKHNDIICILDNSSIKENKFLYGFDLIVKKPEILQFVDNPEDCLIMIFTGAYVDEIKKQILQINKNLNIVTIHDFIISN